MFFATVAGAQNNVLCIELPIRPEFKKIERSITRELSISGKCGKDSTEHESWITMDSRLNIVTVGDLPDGVYKVSVSEDYHNHYGKYVEGFSLGLYRFPEVILNNNATTYLKKEMPGDCKYFRDFVDNNCPVCHSNKNVVRICRGFEILDPYGTESEAKEKPQFNCHFSEIYSGCETTVCSPIWYCNDDKIEF